MAAALVLPEAGGLAGCGGDERRIVRAAIHPAIGIARVGNSKETFFFGPELPGTLPRAPGGFKDAPSAIARQAAHFRVYGLDANGAAGQEAYFLQEAQIDWRVHVANSKAARQRLPGSFRHPGRAAGPTRARNHVGGRERPTAS